MAKTFTAEEKAAIVQEYKAAVELGHGGGADVALKHGIGASQIHNWARRQHAASKKVTAAHRQPRRKPDREGAPAQWFSEAAALNSLISFHRQRAEFYEKLRDGHHA